MKIVEKKVCFLHKVKKETGALLKAANKVLIKTPAVLDFNDYQSEITFVSIPFCWRWNGVGMEACLSTGEIVEVKCIIIQLLLRK